MSESDVEHGAPSSLDAMVKKMVRLALASEYSRLPIRRTDISAKVLGESMGDDEHRHTMVVPHLAPIVMTVLTGYRALIWAKE